MSKTIVIISGPPGAGKRPLARALQDGMGVNAARVKVLVKPAPGIVMIEGTGIYRIGTSELEAMNSDPYRYARATIREEENAIDLDAVENAWRDHDVVVVVAYSALAMAIVGHPRVKDWRAITVFLSPFSEQEVRACQEPESVLSNIMIGRMMERLVAERVRERGMVSADDMLGCVLRKDLVWEEMQARNLFQLFLVLRGGHRPRAWDNPEEGEAGEALRTLLERI